MSDCAGYRNRAYGASMAKQALKQLVGQILQAFFYELANSAVLGLCGGIGSTNLMWR
jgi:hypothetical protein